MFLTIVFLVLVMASYHVSAFQLLRTGTGVALRNALRSNPALSAAEVVAGVDLPDEISKLRAVNDMVLVERISAPEKTASGLFIRATEGRDKKHLAKVISVPDANQKIVNEHGNVIPVSTILPCKIGDTVFVKVRRHCVTHSIGVARS